MLHIHVESCWEERFHTFWWKGLPFEPDRGNARVRKKLNEVIRHMIYTLRFPLVLLHAYLNKLWKLNNGFTLRCLFKWIIDSLEKCYFKEVMIFHFDFSVLHHVLSISTIVIHSCCKGDRTDFESFDWPC